ncbi:MAG: ADP-ribosyltransferase [Pseudomonadota bacterium]|nr:ADP-ribosyltransferase [Pseudomonadota bacterium]
MWAGQCKDLFTVRGSTHSKKIHEVLFRAEVLDALKRYKGASNIHSVGYDTINSYLRNTLKGALSREQIQQVKAIVSILDRVFEDLPPLAAPIVVFRSELIGGREQRQGEIIEFSSFTSTSREREVVEIFPIRDANQPFRIYTILLRAEDRAIDFKNLGTVGNYKFDSESEVLLPRKMKFKIISSQRIGNIEYQTLVPQ